MIYNLKQAIVDICHNDYKIFFYKPNVQGIALGYKYINGINTMEICIHVFVDEKVASNLLPPNGLIPPYFKGLKTDVIETGKFSTNDFTDNLNFSNFSFINTRSYNERIRPIQPGYCMSVAFGTSPFTSAGTFGYIVLDKSQISKTYCLLSVNKTFAAFNTAEIGTEVVQPAYSYGGRTPKDTVAKLLRFSTIKFDDSIPNSLEEMNTIDASVASYFNVGEVQLINPFIPGIGIPKGIITPTLNENIKWTGSYIGSTKGIITSLASTIKLDYQNQEFAWFKDVIIASGISYAQDFGALVCNNDNKALGLLFGNTFNKILCICDISTVLETLNLSLLTN